MSQPPLQRAILVDLLISGDDKAENIGRRTKYHRNTVSGAMKELVSDELIEAKGGGVYRLTDRGRTRAQNIVRSGLEIYERD
jgi:Mn-dependent DtxR family transcriptional regulator